MFWTILRAICKINVLRITLLFISETIWHLYNLTVVLLIISLVIFLVCNIFFPIYNFVILYFSWEIYESFYMNFDSRYNSDQVTRFVSKYTCPPMFLSRFFWNIFKLVNVLLENNNVVVFLNHTSSINLSTPFFFLSLFILFLFLLNLIKTNLFKSFLNGLMFNNVFLFFLNIFNKIEFTGFWLKIKNYFI